MENYIYQITLGFNNILDEVDTSKGNYEEITYERVVERSGLDCVVERKSGYLDIDEKHRLYGEFMKNYIQPLQLGYLDVDNFGEFVTVNIQTDSETMSNLTSNLKDYEVDGCCVFSVSRNDFDSDIEIYMEMK